MATINPLGNPRAGQARLPASPEETLDGSQLISHARALLRGEPSAADVARWAGRLTAYEDWCEMVHSRIDRSNVRDVRRRLEDRLDALAIRVR